LEDVVSTAYRSNAAFFDTAERYGSHLKTAFGMGYGETEQLTKLLVQKAKLMDGPARVEPVVASKFTPLPWRTTAQSVVDACEQSCKNLGVDSIDLYQIHMPDSKFSCLFALSQLSFSHTYPEFSCPVTPSLPVVQPLRTFGKVDTKDAVYWDGIAECYHKGLVKNVGVCNYGPTLLEKCHNALSERGVPLATNQIAFSLLGRKNGSLETIEKCNELGVRVLAYYPFAMGLLTGKYSRDSSVIKDDGALVIDPSLMTKKKTSLEQQDLLRYANEDGFASLIEAMSSIAERRGKTISQVALNYIVSKGAIPIPGCRTVSQLEDNLGAMGWRLSEAEMKDLELKADKLPNFDGAGFKRTNEKFVGYGIERWELD
jgi:pyridoxine 4-dehydrogenase